MLSSARGWDSRILHVQTAKYNRVDIQASKIVLKIYQYTGQERILVDVCTLKPPVSTKALRENFGATLEEENGGSIFFERVTEPGIYCIEDAKRKRGVTLVSVPLLPLVLFICSLFVLSISAAYIPLYYCKQPEVSQ